MAIGLRSVGASPGANSANCIITKPSGLSLGDFILAHIVNKATSGTITPPADWMIIGAQSNTASSRSALFRKVAVQADVDATTFTFTLGTSGRNRGEMMALTGVSTSAPIDVANQQINGAGTSIAVPTPTVTTGCLVLVIGSNALGGVATACSGADPACTITIGYAVAYSTYCALACFSGIKSGTDAIDAHSLSTFTSAVSSGHAVALAPQPAPEEHSGAALIHGNGTITPVVQKNGKGSALASGNGSLAGIVQKAGLGSAIASGKGVLVALGTVALMGLASLSGGPGHQIAAGLKTSQNISAISGGGSLTATGEASIAPEEHSGVAAISGTGILTSSGAKATSISASISGAGSLIGDGLKAAADLGAIHANGSLVATGTAVEFHSGAAALSGGGAASGIGLKAGSITAGPISGSGSQVANGAKAGFAIAGMTGGGSLSATGEASGVEHHSGAAAISGSGSLSSAGIKDGKDSTAISGNGTLITSGAKAVSSTASISKAGALTSMGQKAVAGLAMISGNGSIIATGEEAKPEDYFGVALISGGCYLTASGTAWWYDQSKRKINRRASIRTGQSIRPMRSVQPARPLKRPTVRKKTTRRNYP